LTTGIALSVSKAETLQVSGDRSPTFSTTLAREWWSTRIDKALKVWRGREPVNLAVLHDSSSQIPYIVSITIRVMVTFKSDCGAWVLDEFRRCCNLHSQNSLRKLICFTKFNATDIGKSVFDEALALAKATDPVSCCPSGSPNCAHFPAWNTIQVWGKTLRSIKSSGRRLKKHGLELLRTRKDEATAAGNHWIYSKIWQSKSNYLSVSP